MSIETKPLPSSKALSSNDPIDRYICEHSLRYTSEQGELLEATKDLPGTSFVDASIEDQFSFP